MDTMTPISQRHADRLPALALGTDTCAPTTASATFVHVPTADTGNTNAMYMSWLGGVGENGCVSAKNVSKRTTTGRLDWDVT